MHNEYTPEEILALLENGSSADDIAQSFTKALNDALELQKVKEKEAAARKLADEARAKAKAEAEEKARKRESAKREDTEALIEMFEAYLEEYYPEVELNTNLDVDGFIKLLDSWFKLNTQFKSLLDTDLFKSAFGW